MDAVPELPGGVEEALEHGVRHRPHPVEHRANGCPERGQLALGGRGLADVAHGDRRHRHALQLGRDERRRRRDDDVQKRRQIVRHARDEVAVELEQLARPGRRVEEGAARHARGDRVQLELERDGDAEIAAAAAEPPEEVGALVVARGDEPAVRRDDVHGAEIVDREAVLPHQPAVSPAEREPRDAGRRDAAARRREPERLRLVVELAPPHARLRANEPALGVHVERLEERQVEREPPVADRQACGVVTAAANRERHVPPPRELDPGEDVGGVRAAEHGLGTALRARVPHAPPLVVALLPLQPKRAASRPPQLVVEARHRPNVVGPPTSRLLGSCATAQARGSGPAQGAVTVPS